MGRWDAVAVSDGDGDDSSGSTGDRRVRRSRQSESERERPPGRAGRDIGAAGRTGERRDVGTGSARSRVGRVQHSLGNQAVQRLAGDGLQRAAATGGEGDRFEREAQRVAEAAVRPGGRSGTDPEAVRSADSGLCGRCQRRRRAGKSLDCPECLASLRESAASHDPSDGSEPDGLQRTTTEIGGGSTPLSPGGSPADDVDASTATRSQEGSTAGGTDRERTNAESGTEPAPGNAGTRGSDAGSDPTIGASSGRGLPGSVRSEFEWRLGYDFGGVRIHTGPRADAIARDLDAVAFTVGQNVFFRAGAYRPSTIGGKRLLAHELTHVVQQGGSEPLATESTATGRAASPAGSSGSTPAVARREDATVRRQGLGLGLGPGALLGNTWLRLGRSMKLRVVDTAIQGALTTIENFPGKAMLGGLWTFVKPGLRGFYERLQAAKADVKITAVDKLARIMSGQSVAYAKGLLIGTVKGFFVDGLWGIFEAIKMVINGATKLWDFLGAVRELVGAFPEKIQSLYENAKGIAATLATNVGPAMQEIENLLTDPQAVAKLIGPIVEAGKSKAAELGNTIAGKLLEFFTKPGSEATVGRATGRLIGMVLFEVVFAYLTAGTGTAVTAIKTVGRALAKLGGRIAGSVLRVFKLLLPYFDTVVDAVKAAGRFLKGRVLGTVADQFADLLDTVKDLFNRFLKHCHESKLECDFSGQAASKADEAGTVTSKADEVGRQADEVDTAGRASADLSRGARRARELDWPRAPDGYEWVSGPADRPYIRRKPEHPGPKLYYDEEAEEFVEGLPRRVDRPRLPQGSKAKRMDEPERSGGRPVGAGKYRRFNEPLRGAAAKRQQRILDLAETNPQQAGREYQELIAEDLGAVDVQEMFARPGRRPDIGTGHEVTIEGRTGSLSSKKLDQLWLDMRDRGNVLLTVPRLSGKANDQLRRLAAQANDTFDHDVLFVIRETLP